MFSWGTWLHPRDGNYCRIKMDNSSDYSLALKFYLSYENAINLETKPFQRLDEQWRYYRREND